MLGTIAGAGTPPSAALSPGVPSSPTGESNAPPAHAGWAHSSDPHAGSSMAIGLTEFVAQRQLGPKTAFASGIDRNNRFTQPSIRCCSATDLTTLWVVAAIAV